MVEAALALLFETRRRLERYEYLLVEAGGPDLELFEIRNALQEALVEGANAVNELGGSLREAARLLTAES